MGRESEAGTVDLGDGLGDWRFRFVEKVMRRDRLARASALGELQAPNGDRFEFTDFMPPALFLNVAIAADVRANALRDRLTPEEFVARSGPFKTVPDNKIGPLFDFIEQSTVAAVLSFQALEAYSNFVIRFKLEDGEYVFELPRQPKKNVPAEDIERYGELMQKLKTVVPHLLNVDPPTGETFWPKLWDMKRVRDALTHLKFKDQMAAASTMAASNAATRADPESVFYKLVSGASKDFSRTAVEALDYFHQRDGTPRWLLYPLSVYGIAPTPSKRTKTIVLGPPE